MKIYVVIHENRHTDVAVYAFANEIDAIERAHEIVEEYDDSDKTKEFTVGAPYLYYAACGAEGDNVCVEEIELR